MTIETSIALLGLLIAAFKVGYMIAKDIYKQK